MSYAFLSIAALIGAILIGIKRKVNIGIVAMFFAFVLSRFVFEGIDVNKLILKGWPLKIFFIMMSAMFLFSFATINGATKLLANKLASLDPSGCGIELEANKPNWFDALNGLPALFGSSSCETFEVKRLILILKEALQQSKLDAVFVTEEVKDFLAQIGGLIVIVVAESTEITRKVFS